ncbi:unnamed protein product [Rhizoctonia solani]|uniref:Uncharacterized protein n=1 Tax=Rhizoctonia solani TaxID=456999 RepID=A0A8H2WBL6_9AGAM|nr:unnamed protein product [Rhizoctonia solani]
MITPKVQMDHIIRHLAMRRGGITSFILMSSSQPRRNRVGKLSIQTHSTDSSPREAFNLDKFIRENESWAPPSPREILARRLFREAQQASNMKPRKSSSQSSGDYLIRRSLKGEHMV